MGQVTIYVEDDALEAAKRSAERSKMSVSQWFARFAIEEKQRQSQNWDTFFATLDALKVDGEDFPSIDEIRHNSSPDSTREPW